MTKDTEIQIHLEATVKDSGLRRGVITIDRAVIPQFTFLDLDDTTIQGDLKKVGAYETIHRVLLLPDYYQVIAIFFDILTDTWKILVESPMLPAGEPGSWLADIEPVYEAIYYENPKTGTVDKVPQLVNIHIRTKKRGLKAGDIINLVGDTKDE